MRQRRRAGLTGARAELLREQGRVEERIRIARDVHDTIAQGLSAITMLLRAAEQALPTDASGAEKVRERLQAAYEIALLSLGQAQDLTTGVAASQLAEGGLGPALEQYCLLSRRSLEAVRQLAETGPLPVPLARVPEVRLEVVGPVRRLSLPAESAALRMAQEAVCNAVRHSGASEIVVGLRQLDERVRISVRDDGTGMPAAPEAGVGLGLNGVSQRVRELGGELFLESEPGGGTTVTVEFRHPK